MLASARALEGFEGVGVLRFMRREGPRWRGGSEFDLGSFLRVVPAGVVDMVGQIVAL